MNQQTIFEKHSHSTYIESEEGFHRVMLADDFAQAAAEIRRQARREALEEVGAFCDKRVSLIEDDLKDQTYWSHYRFQQGARNEALLIAEQARALAQTEQEKS